MTNERAAHQCHADGCDSAAAFTTKANLLCRAPGVAPVPVRFECSIKVCAKHAKESTVRRYLLNDHNREQITTGLMDGGYPEPDMLSLRIDFEPIKREVVRIDHRPVLKCDYGGCTKKAAWQIEQHFRMMWQRGKGKPQVKVLTNLCVCEEHKGVVKPANLQNKAAEASTRKWLNDRGVSLPDFESMTLGFEPLHDGRRVQPKLWVGDDGPLDQFKPVAPAKAEET